jgi:hypothetical protein
LRLSASIRAASLWGPGLEGWTASLPILTGAAAYVPAASPPPAPVLLPPAERRRAGPVIRLALAVAHEAATLSGLPPDTLDAVFASSNGDGPIVGAILDALATDTDTRVVSPTQFHNSVHNAAAGYWSIATASRRPATCIGCHDESWAAALLTAFAGLHTTGTPVLLVCYDHPLPPPLDAARATGPAFAAAFILTPPAGGPTLHLTYAPETRSRPTAPDPRFAGLMANPAARALPLLTALAQSVPLTHDLAYQDGSITLEFLP